MLRRTLAIVLLLLAAAGVATAQPLDDAAREGAAHGYIAALIDASAALSLPPRVDRALMLTLLGAQDAAHEGQVSIALTFLRTFTFEVRGVKRAKRVPPEAADGLIAKAEDTIRYLSRFNSR